MSSSSTPSKVNCLVIRTLHFRGVRGDLQERPYLFFPMPIPFFPSTKSPILCSKSLKSGVPKGKSAQKPRFCARNARKRGFRRPKTHKNGVFVLEKPEFEGSEGLDAHGLCGRVANSAGNGCHLARDAGVGCWKWLPPGRGWCGGWPGAAAWPGADAQTQNKKQKRVTAKCHPRLFVV